MIEIHADAESLSGAAADLFVEEARKAAAGRGRFAVVLSGGETPRRTYALLARPPRRNRVPWERVHVFWGDERCVPPADPRSNERLAREVLLDHVPLPAEQIHPLRCAADPGQAAARYESLLRDFFGKEPPRFDLVFLGLGENGHTASLFPHTAVLAEQVRWAAEVYVSEQNLYRVTLTAPFLNRAAALAVFLVAGAGKAEILREVLEGPAAPRRLPAQLIRPAAGEVRWLVEREAARLVGAHG